MEKKEQELLDHLARQTESVKAPDSLQPELVEQMVSKTRKKAPKSRVVQGLLAASFLAVCGIGYMTSQNAKNEHTSKDALSISKSSHIKSAESYDEVFGYIEEYQKQMSSEAYTTDAAPDNNGNVSESKTMPDQSQGSYSATNVRQEGIDEPDIVKTDGRYLYVLGDSGESIAILDTEKEIPFKVGEITLEEGETATEFFVKEHTLVLICGRNNWNYGVMPLDGARGTETTDQGSVLTRVMTYDLTDISAPKKTGEVTQSGFYDSARLDGNYVYLFSRYNVNIGADRNEIPSFVPYAGGMAIPESKISLPSLTDASSYEVITSFNIEKPDEIVDSRAILTKGGDLYVSNENIYWYEQNWDTEAKTSIRKFSYKDGKIEAEAQSEIAGYINDSFSIDEYEGYLRVAVTDGDTNGIYIMDENLKQTGSLKGLAKEERIYSARFLGDTAYMVTFKETDPLFSVDLTDPSDPKVLGELKIPGFSEYLHFYGDNRLLGIGMEVDTKTQSTNGVKLSMFNIKDKTDVEEVQKYVMENMYSTEALYNYKAVLIDKEKNVIGFSGFEGDKEYYCLFSYDEEKGFMCNLKETVNGSGNQSTRGVFSGDSLYVIKGNIIEQYSLNTYEKTGDIIL